MSCCTFGNDLALSGLVVVSESGNVLCALAALLALNAGREIFQVASGTYSRLVPQTPEKLRDKLRDKACNEKAGFQFPQENWCPRRDSNARPSA